MDSKYFFLCEVRTCSDARDRKRENETEKEKEKREKRKKRLKEKLMIDDRKTFD